jgi:hypothetical protein
LQILELTGLLTKNLWKIEYFGVIRKEKSLQSVDLQAFDAFCYFFK